MTPHWSRRAKVVQAVCLAGAAVLAVGGVAAIVWPERAEPAASGVLAVVAARAGPMLTHGDDRLPARPNLPPRTGGIGWPCEGDGTEGKRVQWLYGHTGTDNLASLRPSFEQFARKVEGVFSASSDGQLVARYVTGADCSLSIEPVLLSDRAVASFDQMVRELEQQGYDRPDRKYHVWTEAAAYCGIGTVTADDRPDGNAADTGTGYSRTDRDCWDYAEAHELLHNLGAVQLSAPNSTGGWHCRDGYDVMCYADGGPTDGQVIRCDLLSETRRLDCRDDDYFAVAPDPGGYLGTHWNVARSGFLAPGATPSTTPDTVPPTTVPPTTTTTTGQGRTQTSLTFLSEPVVGADVFAVAAVRGDCGPTGVVAFRVSGQVVSRIVVDQGVAAVALRFTRPGRFTVRAEYLGDDGCSASTDSVRRRVTG